MQKLLSDADAKKYGAIVAQHSSIEDETTVVLRIDLPALAKALEADCADPLQRKRVRKLAKYLGRERMAKTPRITKIRFVEFPEPA